MSAVPTIDRVPATNEAPPASTRTIDDFGPRNAERPDWQTAPLIENPNAIERFFQSKLNRPEDVVFVRVALQASIVVPLAALFFAVESFSWFLALPYWALVFLVFADRVGLTIHALIHRPLFKRGHPILQQYIPGFLCVFFGHTPHTFYIHHIGMHHSEGNMWDDTSSTLVYERDNILHFLHYWMRFLFLGMFDLLLYQWKKGRMKLFRLMILVEGGYMAAVAALFMWNPQATTVVFLVPVFVMRYAMMAGNWGQHAFVCPDDPDNEYKKSTNLLHARHNFRCFNDGFHIVHHIKPGLHFTEMPQHFLDNVDEYVENDAICFSGLKGNQVIWALLMKRDYDTLAKHYVHLGGEEKSHEEVKALLKKRTRPIPRPA